MAVWLTALMGLAHYWIAPGVVTDPIAHISLHPHPLVQTDEVALVLALQKSVHRMTDT